MAVPDITYDATLEKTEPAVTFPVVACVSAAVEPATTPPVENPAIKGAAPTAIKPHKHTSGLYYCTTPL